jgi:hypothetical protein
MPYSINDLQEAKFLEYSRNHNGISYFDDRHHSKLGRKRPSILHFAESHAEPPKMSSRTRAFRG